MSEHGAQQYGGQTAVPVSKEDRTRVQQSLTDTRSLLKEVTELISQTLGIKIVQPTKYAVTIVPAAAGTTAMAAGDGFTVCVQDQFGCGCYEDPPGICRPCNGPL